MMLGFELDIWDYLTFLTLFLSGAAVVSLWVWLAGLPGRIAIARKHPEAEAVNLLGWAGLLPTIYPWVQALIWAFKPTEIIDIRRFPREEARAIDEDVARLRGTSSKEAAESSVAPKGAGESSVPPKEAEKPPEGQPGPTEVQPT